MCQSCNETLVWWSSKPSLHSLQAFKIYKRNQWFECLMLCSCKLIIPDFEMSWGSLLKAFLNTIKFTGNRRERDKNSQERFSSIQIQIQFFLLKYFSVRCTIDLKTPKSYYVNIKCHNIDSIAYNFNIFNSFTSLN